MERYPTTQEYYIMKYQQSSFQCPYCYVYAHQEWSSVFTDNNQLGRELTISNESVEASVCAHCSQASFWVGQELIYPLQTKLPRPNSDLSKEIKEVYEEAARIADLSPRAACALLRLAIELLLKQLGVTGSINDAIKKLVEKGLDVRIQQSLDVVRVTGNNAVHPGTIAFDDTTNVRYFFRIVNYIAHSLITQPKQIQEFFEDLPEEDKKKISKRDGKE